MTDRAHDSCGMPRLSMWRWFQNRCWPARHVDWPDVPNDWKSLPDGTVACVRVIAITRLSLLDRLRVLIGGSVRTEATVMAIPGGRSYTTAKCWATTICIERRAGLVSDAGQDGGGV